MSDANNEIAVDVNGVDISQISDANNEIALDTTGVDDVNDQPEASIGEKRRREGKSRSIAWEHFTKLRKEDGTWDKCRCIHCHKLFSYARGGTTHLLRHIRDGSCPVYKNEKTGRSDVPFSSRGCNSERRNSLAWKSDQVTSHPGPKMGLQYEVPVSFDDLGYQATEALEDEFGGRLSAFIQGRQPQQPAVRSQPRGEPWMNELRACVGRLVDLTSENIPRAVPIKPLSAVAAPDYSIAAALRCLNEMEDIPQSSEMYLDAFGLLKDAGERECFICLAPEPRRRWLQRLLHRHYPLRYNYDF